MNCPVCSKKYQYKADVIHHINVRHPKSLPHNMSAAKYLFSITHNGRTTGICRICGSDTKFDEKTGRTKVFCEDPKCKQSFAEIAQNRNINKYGVPHLLNNQEHQMYMLSRRKISGEYIDRYGNKIPYVGSYERRFLEFLDIFLEFDLTTVHSPCPFSIQYEFDGEVLTYTPDFYIDILDLVVEIKHGGDNPNMHHKIQAVDVKKDKAKALAIKTKTKHNYIKIVDNKFEPFLEALFKLVEDKNFERNERLFILKESDLLETQSIAALAPISTTANFIDTERYNDEVENSDKLFIKAIVDKDTEGYVTSGVSFNETSDDFVIFENGTFIKMDKEKYKGHSYLLFQYDGPNNIKNDIEKFKDNVENDSEYLTDIDAITESFGSIFSDMKVVTPVQLLFNSEFKLIKRGMI